MNQQDSSNFPPLPDDSVDGIYVCGPMTGYLEHNYPAFNTAAATLRAMGYVNVVNPAELHPFVGKSETWDYYLRKDIHAMLTCSVLLLLEGWEQSKGAKLECHIAQQLNFMIVSFTPEGQFHYHSFT